MSWAAGTQAVLRCQSPRMVWTQDRLHDRQRVVHWDLSGVAGSQGRRLVDMYSAGEQRVYEPRDNGRLLLSPSAFHDGNFSLLIRGTLWNRGGAETLAGIETLAGGGHIPLTRLGLRKGGALERRGRGGDRTILGRGYGGRCVPHAEVIFCEAAVEEGDEGVYTCNLHHHYCHLYESLAVRLEVTDDRECAPHPPFATAIPAPASLSLPLLCGAVIWLPLSMHPQPC